MRCIPAAIFLVAAVAFPAAAPAFPVASSPAPAPTPAATPMQTKGSNVTVTQCQAKFLEKPPLKIGYSNTAAQTATEIDFAVVTTAGIIRTVKDTGTFASGKAIAHVFDLPDTISPLGLSSARCIVTKVTYQDGTTWVNPSPP
jgi:hypothetical protein